MGPVSSGRGGTNIAHKDNGVMILDNPAALASVKSKTFEVDADILLVPIEYKDAQGSDNGKDTVNFLPSFSYLQSIEEDRIGFGVGLFIPAGFSTVGILPTAPFAPFATLPANDFNGGIVRPTIPRTLRKISYAKQGI